MIDSELQAWLEETADRLMRDRDAHVELPPGVIQFHWGPRHSRVRTFVAIRATTEERFQTTREVENFSLVDFLHARLSEDEELARSATAGPWVEEFSGETGHIVLPADAEHAREYVARTQLYAAQSDAAHIARHDPARVLREVEAKRRIVDLIADDMQAASGEVATADFGEEMARWAKAFATARLLAVSWDDHPDYREEWRP